MTVFIKPDDLPVIEKLAASDPSQTIRKRVRLLLLYEAGMKTAEIAGKVDLSPGRVLYWRRQYLKDGLGVFGDAVENLGEGKLKAEKGKKTKKTRLGRLTRLAGEAAERGEAIEAQLDALAVGIASAEKRRKKLKKALKNAKKKKAARARKQLKRIGRRIKRAKKTLERLSA